MDFRQEPRTVFESDGVKVINTHSGQERAYGDSYYKYHVIGADSEEDAYALCQEHGRKCDLPTATYRKEDGPMSKHFREHYNIKPDGFGGFLYTVTWPWTG